MSTAQLDTRTRALPRFMASLVAPLVAPLGAGAFAVALSLIAIAVPSVWYDESATVSSATRSWPQLWAEIHSVDAVHAVYYAGMHLVFDAVGYSPFSLRLPSAIAVGVAAALTVVLGRQLGRPSLGLVAGIVFAVLPRVTWAGGEGRSYAITTALAVGLTVALVRAARSARRRDWVLYAGLAALSSYVFVYLALIVLAHGIAVSLARWPLRRWALSAASAALFVAPFAVFTATHQTKQIDWLPRLNATTWYSVFVEQWFVDSWGFALAAWLILAVGIATVWRSRRTDARAALLLPLATAPTVMLLVATSVAFPVYTPRYVSMCLPFVALLMAAAIDAAPWRRVRVIALALVVAGAMPALVDSLQPEAKEGSSWKYVAALIASHRSGDTAIIYGTVQKHPTATTRVIAYSYPAAFAGTTDVTLGTTAAASGRLWGTVLPLGETLDRLSGKTEALLITSKSRDLRPETTAQLASIGWQPTQQWSRAKVNIVKYEPWVLAAPRR
ncbi:glycosyltransferase family 39 protein [soil metagenome]